MYSFLLAIYCLKIKEAFLKKKKKQVKQFLSFNLSIINYNAFFKI